MQLSLSTATPLTETVFHLTEIGRDLKSSFMAHFHDYCYLIFWNIKII